MAHVRRRLSEMVAPSPGRFRAIKIAQSGPQFPPCGEPASGGARGHRGRPKAVTRTPLAKLITHIISHHYIARPSPPRTALQVKVAPLDGTSDEGHVTTLCVSLDVPRLIPFIARPPGRAARDERHFAKGWRSRQGRPTGNALVTAVSA